MVAEKEAKKPNFFTFGSGGGVWRGWGEVLKVLGAFFAQAKVSGKGGDFFFIFVQGKCTKGARRRIGLIQKQGSQKKSSKN